jgi:hypothetical protein
VSAIILRNITPKLLDLPTEILNFRLICSTQMTVCFTHFNHIENSCLLNYMETYANFRCIFLNMNRIWNFFFIFGIKEVYELRSVMKNVASIAHLTFNRLHGVISQNIEIFITSAVRTSNPTCVKKFLNLRRKIPILFITWYSIITLF